LSFFGRGKSISTAKPMIKKYENDPGQDGGGALARRLGELVTGNNASQRPNVKIQRGRRPRKDEGRGF
jgi:hypothetical protein